jgi:hypothetical protein
MCKIGQRDQITWTPYGASPGHSCVERKTRCGSIKVSFLNQAVEPHVRPLHGLKHQYLVRGQSN